VGVHLCPRYPSAAAEDAQTDQRTLARLRVHSCAFQATLTKGITRAVCQGFLIINGHDETGGYRFSFRQSLRLYRGLLRGPVLPLRNSRVTRALKGPPPARVASSLFILEMPSA
jgi:hypothetical protein